MKAPTKDELRAQIAELKKENANLRRQITKEKHRAWEEKKDQAFNILYRSVPYRPSEMYNTTLDHIDESGYWFTFGLWNGKSRQTFCVRHTDL